MSAFLGKIHYWLYNKIMLQEHLLEEVLKLAESKGYSTTEIINESNKIYGFPVMGELENQINHGNIHGWLQERIQSVEGRLAFSVTELLKLDESLVVDFTEVFKKNGIEVMGSLDKREYSAQDLFTLIFDNMLEGMPCDRVNEIIENDENVVSWKTTACLHKDYWYDVGGDVTNFYQLRDAWINGFLAAYDNKFEFIKTAEDINTIRKV